VRTNFGMLGSRIPRRAGECGDPRIPSLSSRGDPLAGFTLNEPLNPVKSSIAPMNWRSGICYEGEILCIAEIF